MVEVQDYERWRYIFITEELITVVIIVVTFFLIAP